MSKWGELMADAIGVPVEALHAEWKRRYDERCRAHVACLRADPSVTTRLNSQGFVCVVEGADGLGTLDSQRLGLRLIHSVGREADGNAWAHISLSRRDRKLPTWEQTRDAFRLIYPERTGVIVIPPSSAHVNRAEVMHVWCNLDAPSVPEFSWHGSI